MKQKKESTLTAACVAKHSQRHHQKDTENIRTDLEDAVCLLSIIAGLNRFVKLNRLFRIKNIGIPMVKRAFIGVKALVSRVDKLDISGIVCLFLSILIGYAW